MPSWMTAANRQRVLLQIIGQRCQHCTISENREKQKGWGKRNGNRFWWEGEVLSDDKCPCHGIFNRQWIQVQVSESNWTAMYYIQGMVTAATI
uniref:Uncharacterized protein n=1 Tax=Arundo donax TaxID=35708 RepID=A0A0A8Y6M1_ARUDO